jgi:hypothetical protein
MVSFGGESEAAADRCDRTGAAHAAEAKRAERVPATEVIQSKQHSMRRRLRLKENTEPALLRMFSCLPANP